MVTSVSSDPLDANNPDVAHEPEVQIPQGEAASDDSVVATKDEGQETQETLTEDPEKADIAPQESDEGVVKQKRQERLEKRLSEFSRGRDEALRLAEQERAARIALEARLQEYGQSPQAKPVYENYADPYQYAEALAQYEAGKARTETEQKIRNELRQERDSHIRAQWHAKQEAAKGLYEDYDLVTGSATAVVSDEIQQAILDSDIGPHLLYRLADDDALVNRLSRLPTPSALRELGKIEASIENELASKKQKAVKGSSSPTPISPLKTTGSNVHSIVRNDSNHAVIENNLDNYRALRRAGKIR